MSTQPPTDRHTESPTSHIRTGPDATDPGEQPVTDSAPGPLARFNAWRTQRPFLGGTLLMLAGVIIAYVPVQFATELLLVGGSFTFLGLLFAVLVFLSGLFALKRPEFAQELGIFGVAMSILSIFGALGGLFVGLFVGLVGGNLCIAWRSPADADADEARTASSVVR